MEKTLKSKILGTFEMLLAAIIIIVAVKYAPAKKDIVPTPVTVPETTTVEQTTQQPAEVITEAPTAPETTGFADAGEYSVTNYIVVTANSAMEMYSISREKLYNYANVINTFAAKVPDRQVYCLLAPTSIAFYGPEEYRTGSHSQPDGINIAYSALSGANIKKTCQKEVSDRQKYLDFSVQPKQSEWPIYRLYVYSFQPPELCSISFGMALLPL